MKDLSLICLLWKFTQELAKVDNYANYQFIVSQLQTHPSLSALGQELNPVIISLSKLVQC